MYKLHLKTSEVREKTIQLYNKDNLIDEVSGDVDVVDSIKNILEKNDLDPKDIEEFTYDKGPGSYTGLKIASSVINTLNWVFNKKEPDKMDMPEYGSEPNISKPKKPQSII
jgi:hypothetical protein